MKIGIQTWGTDGDILPFLALAGGLKRAGHEVSCVYTSVDNKDYTELCGRLDFTAERAHWFEVSPAAWEAFKRCLAREKLPVKHLQAIFDDFYEPAIAEMYQGSMRLCAENDLVIGHWALHTVQCAAEKTGTPHVSVILNHSGIASRHLTPVGLPNLGDWLNPFWWKLVDAIINWGMLKYYNPLRQEIGLAPYRSVLKDVWESKLLNLVAVSPTICARPSDWPDFYRVCGFFNLPVDLADWQMGGELEEFLGRGEPPFYLTFGSMATMEEEYEQTVLDDFNEVVRQTGIRAIIQTRLAEEGVSRENPDIYYINRVPHRRIFPQCQAIVHHGGAGTTQAALQSGRPSIIVAHIADQYFWGRQLMRLGAAPKPILRQGLSLRKLSRAINRVRSDKAMQARAAELGRRMAGEDGIEQAVAAIDRIFLVSSQE